VAGVSHCVETLKKRADFLRLRKGRKFTTSFFILRALPSDVAGSGAIRVGYTVTTKCGNAVVRNRIKRRLRALVRELFPEHAKTGYDYLLVALDSAKPSAAECEPAQLREAMAKAITRIHA
jgi:ribonuclease P protein component